MRYHISQTKRHDIQYFFFIILFFLGWYSSIWYLHLTMQCLSMFRTERNVDFLLLLFLFCSFSCLCDTATLRESDEIIMIKDLNDARFSAHHRCSSSSSFFSSVDHYYRLKRNSNNFCVGYILLKEHITFHIKRYKRFEELIK